MKQRQPEVGANVNRLYYVFFALRVKQRQPEVGETSTVFITNMEVTSTFGVFEALGCWLGVCASLECLRCVY